MGDMQSFIVVSSGTKVPSSPPSPLLGPRSLTHVCFPLHSLSDCVMNDGHTGNGEEINTGLDWVEVETPRAPWGLDMPEG
jgi:hypothetical protein